VGTARVWACTYPDRQATNGSQFLGISQWAQQESGHALTPDSQATNGNPFLCISQWAYREYALSLLISYSWLQC
jgi:hypothetical protein